MPNKDLVLDAEFMFDVTLSPTGDLNQDAADVALVSAALLLLVCHLVGSWPLTILLSPQATINFKNATATLVICGGRDIDIFYHHQPPYFVTLPPVQALVRFLGVALTDVETLVCRLCAHALSTLPLLDS
jgi:hypothetical protein